MSRENVELLLAGLDAWNSGDFPAIIEMCDPDVVWTFSDRLPDATGAIHGKAAVARFFESFTEDWSEIEIRQQRSVDTQDVVVAEVEFRAKGRDGIEVTMNLAHVWTARDGKVISFRAYATFDEALAAAGLSG